MFRRVGCVAQRRKAMPVRCYVRWWLYFHDTVLLLVRPSSSMFRCTFIFVCDRSFVPEICVLCVVVFFTRVVTKHAFSSCWLEYMGSTPALVLPRVAFAID